MTVGASVSSQPTGPKHGFPVSTVRGASMPLLDDEAARDERRLELVAGQLGERGELGDDATGRPGVALQHPLADQSSRADQEREAFCR